AHRASVAPASSCPTRATSVARPPRAATLAAVFAAPPRIRLTLWTLTTGTGASGEILLQSPERYSSRMASPRTSTRLFTKSETIDTSRSDDSAVLMVVVGGAARANAGRQTIVVTEIEKSRAGC